MTGWRWRSTGRASASGLTGDNPSVGCVIVRAGELVARGRHRRGRPAARRGAGAGRRRRRTPRARPPMSPWSPAAALDQRRALLRRASGRRRGRPRRRRLPGRLALRRRAAGPSGLQAAGIAVDPGVAGRGRGRALRRTIRTSVKPWKARLIFGPAKPRAPKRSRNSRPHVCHSPHDRRRPPPHPGGGRRHLRAARPAVGGQARRGAGGVRLDGPDRARTSAAATSATPTSPARSWTAAKFARPRSTTPSSSAPTCRTPTSPTPRCAAPTCAAPACATPT